MQQESSPARSGSMASQWYHLGRVRTLEEIGSLLGVTRERIRQIRNRAFEKLRESPHGESLSGFWNTN